MINFNTTVPQVGTSGISNSFTDVASVSDQNGQLQFYTDGETVRGKNHQLMPNGTHLYGSGSGGTNVQILAIVPKPGSTNLYYLFTESYGFFTSSSNGRAGVYYSVIDMNLNSGNGDVVSGQKNIPLKDHNGVLLDYPNTNTPFKYARITTTLHFDGDKIWLVLLPVFYNGGGDIASRYIYSYLICNSGINNTPDGGNPSPTVHSNVDNTNYPGNFYSDSWGFIKISPNGTHLADATSRTVNLFDYNNQTGAALFNKQIYNYLPSNAISGWGLEFSPNSQFVYFSVMNSIMQEKVNDDDGSTSRDMVYMYQRDIMSKNSQNHIIGQFPAISNNTNSSVPISTTRGYSLQRAVDNKIYVCVDNTDITMGGANEWLGAIAQPNLAYPNCNFNQYEVNLAPVTHHMCYLPQWVYKASINTNNPCNITIWPKVYEAVEPGGGVKVDNNGNILCGLNLNNMANNINHYGVIDNTANVGHTIHYKKSNGMTDWVSQNWWYSTFTSNSSAFTQFSLMGPSIYRSTTTGNIVSGPNYVPSDQPIVAEDNGAFITSFIDHTGATMVDELWVHAPFSVHNSITIPCISGYYVGINKIVFNPATKRLFMYYTNNKIVGNIQKKYLAIYTLSNNTLTNPLHYLIDYPIVGINSLEEVFVLDNNGTVLKYDHLNNTYSSLGVANNNSLTSIETLKQTVEDKIILANFNTSEIYCFNTNPSVLTSKKISATLTSTNYNPMLTSYFIDANYVYLVGGFNTPTFSIGNQTMPLLGNMSSFITKFHVVSDFSFRSANEDFSKTKPSDTFFAKPSKTSEEKPLNTRKFDFTFSLIPNPVKQKITINLMGGNKRNFLSHKVAITNAEGVIMFTEVINQSVSFVDVSKLSIGIYYLTISNSYGDKLTKLFLKE